MHTPFPILLALAAGVLVGCSSDSGPSGASTDVAPYGPSSQGAVVAAPPTPAPATFTWHQRLADAQAEARRTGRLILCLSTKPGCTLCDKFKDEIVPQTRGQLAPVAVGYIYDIRSPEVPQVDQTLRANLKGAGLMPLVGFLTPELRWVHGLWGPTDARKFAGDIRTARGIYPVRTAAIVPTSAVDTSGMTAVINEFGEREWSLPGDVWPTDAPEPEDAITGRPTPAGAAPGPVTMPDTAPALADATPPAPVAPTVPATPVAGPTEPTSPAPGRTFDAPGASEPAPTVAETSPAPAEPAAKPETWARETLDRALQQIQIGNYDGARTLLAEIRERLPQSDLAREAAKGGVAIYNHKKVSAASGVERDEVLSRAQRDLGDTMWGVLFTS